LLRANDADFAESEKGYYAAVYSSFLWGDQEHLWQQRS
jgi:hypothetical protein